ncbi:MAG: hypothetical protein M1823_004227 [Watsoniomyces obsoletus]|nr:MAG: hypothetical protein M1823_004227 [Watsoniomyces obsoletus]
MARRKTRSPSAVPSGPDTPSASRNTRSTSRAAPVTRDTGLVETALRDAPSAPDSNMLGIQVGPQLNFAYGSPDRTAPNTTIRRPGTTSAASLMEKSIHAARTDLQALSPVREVRDEVEEDENEQPIVPATIPRVEEPRNGHVPSENRVHWESTYEEESEESSERSPSETPSEGTLDRQSPDQDDDEEEEMGEDGIQRQLEIEESRIGHHDEVEDGYRLPIDHEDESPPYMETRAPRVRSPEYHARAEDLFNRAAIVDRNHPWASNPNAKASDDDLSLLSKFTWKRITLGLLALCFILPILVTALSMWYTWFHRFWKPHIPVSTGLGNWPIPHMPSPSSYLSSDNHEDRLLNLERVLAALSNQAKEDHSVVQRLAEILPDQIIVSPRSDGGVDIDPAFFSALKAKMQADGLAAGGGSSTTSGSSVDTVQELSQEWAQFLKTNDERIAQHIEQMFTSTRLTDVQKAIDQGVILTKSEFVNILNSKYAEVGDELIQMNEGLNDRILRLQHILEKQVHREIMERYDSVSRQDVLKIISLNELESITQRSYLSNLAKTMENINWFSRSLGACVDPRGTSATYTSSPLNWTLPMTIGRYLYGHHDHHAAQTTSQPPDSILEPWTELHECWCTSVQDEDHDARITIALKNQYILPKEIGIEFPSADATPFYETAPRTVEVWGRIPDRNVWREINRDIQDGEIYRFRGHFTDDPNDKYNPDIEQPEISYDYSDGDAVPARGGGGGVGGGGRRRRTWWGWFKGSNERMKLRNKKKEELRRKLTRGGWTPLTRFQYDIRHPTNQPVQMFELDVDLEKYHHLDRADDAGDNGRGGDNGGNKRKGSTGTGAAVDSIMIRFVDNWGDPERLCVYRVRLHGEEVLVEGRGRNRYVTPSSSAATGGDDDGWRNAVVDDNESMMDGTYSSDEVITDDDSEGESKRKKGGWYKFW